MFQIILALIPTCSISALGRRRIGKSANSWVLNGSLELDAYLTDVAAGSIKGITGVKRETHGQRRNADCLNVSTPKLFRRFYTVGYRATTTPSRASCVRFSDQGGNDLEYNSCILTM